MKRQFALIAFGTLMSAPVLAQGQTPVTGGTMTVRGGRAPIDTIRALLQRRNPTIDELLAWSAIVKAREADFKAANERRAVERAAGVDAKRVLESAEANVARIQEMMAYQRVVAAGCSLLRPHQGEAEGVLGFQIEKSTTFQQRSPVIDKEERFARVPEIVFVEPNTPAAKAGVKEGDMWLGIAGRDILNSYVRDLNDVLKPDNRVSLKLQREGRELNVEVTARKRQEFPEAACENDVFQIHMLPGDAVQRVEIARGTLSPTTMPPGIFTMRIVEGTMSGARFVDLTNAKRAALKAPADEGVLVESIVQGSPAEIAGLQEFDVVTRANNEVILSATDLLRVVRGGGQVSLFVYRDGVGRKVILPAR